MTSNEFLEKLLEETQKDPSLLLLTVIRISIKRLQSKEYCIIDALLAIRQDLDKFVIKNHDDENDFAMWLHKATKIAQAFYEINEENKKTNGRRGSGTAAEMCCELYRLNLAEAQLLFHCDGDKIRQYPLLEQTIVSSIVGCRLHSKQFCNHWLCRK